MEAGDQSSALRRAATDAWRGRAWLVAIGLAAFALNTANLVYLARSEGCGAVLELCPFETGTLSTPDSGGYVALADSIREQGFWATDFYRRPPGYPLILAGATALAGDPVAALWLGPVLAGIAAAAAAWLGAFFAGSRGAGVLAGLAFIAWPNVYQYLPLLLTDSLHASLVLIALAASIHWRTSGRTSAGLLAGALWLVAQSLRPTLLALPALLPFLLWKRSPSRRYAVVSLVLWSATLVVPLFTVASNWSRHGLILPPQACYAAPRLKVQLGGGDFRRLRRECLQEYRKAPLQRARLDGEFLAEHPVMAAKSFAYEILTQLLASPRPYYYSHWHEHYGGTRVMSRGSMGIYWVLAVAALGWLVRRSPGDAIFLAGLGALVMLPAANVSWVGARIRLPVDLVFLPPVAAFLATAVRRLVSLRAGT